MPEEFQRRLPSPERDIADIKPEDIRVALMGTVLDKSDDGMRFVVDDGTGKVTVALQDIATVQVNQLVRVFGRVIPLEQGVEIQGEIVQDMSKLDLTLRKAVKSLKT